MSLTSKHSRKKENAAHTKTLAKLGDLRYTEHTVTVIGGELAVPCICNPL